MAINVLFAAPPGHWEKYESPLGTAFFEAGLDVHLAPDLPPDTVDYIVYAPNPALRDFTPFTRAKAVLTLWAGVEGVVGNPTLRIPLARMVDDGLTRGMVEWVTGHVLRHHLGMDHHIIGRDRSWSRAVPPLAGDRPVTILGLGELGRACALALSRLGFPVTGWSRSQRDLDGVRCVHGAAALSRALAGAEICVLLLPLTRETENLMNRHHLHLLPRGAVLINPGRGALVDDGALLDAVDTGRIGHATLDVFRTEPLAPDHAFWTHPRITVTPHIASETRPDSAARIIAENVRRNEAGEPLQHVVDRDRGY